MGDPNNSNSVDKNVETTKDNTNRMTSKQKTILGLGAVLIICITVIIAIYILRPKPLAEPVAPDASVITAENVLDISQEIADKVAKGMFETHMNTTWKFPNGSSPSSDAIMGNAPSNNYDFYFTITLESGETVFTSGLLPVGSQIAEIILDTELSAGTYPAVVGIHMIDENGDPVENNMGINVTLIIES